MSPERHQQIFSLFDEALELSFAERAALLEQRCRADDELRREVEKMLAAREQFASGFLQESAWEIQARQLAEADQPLPDGTALAQFTILASLGEGGMSRVYLARDTRLNRKVALKVLPARHTLDESRLRRFKGEALKASALNHQNIITIYDFGEAETAHGARHFIAAEYVEGITLRTRLQDGALSIPEALDIAQQIAAALEAAHAAGIIHRDIKPENVMLRPDGVVKVLDFGIAKLTETGETESSPLHRSTEQGTVIGTPGYMSPEQVRGQGVDARTDIFSLGVVLYEMIAGQLPFRGDTSADVMVALLEHEPAALSEFVPSINPKLAQITAKAMAKAPAQRYASTQEYHKALTDPELRTARIVKTLTSTQLKTFRKYLWVGLACLLLFISGVGLYKAYQRWRSDAELTAIANWRANETFQQAIEPERCVFRPINFARRAAAGLFVVRR